MVVLGEEAFEKDFLSWVHGVMLRLYTPGRVVGYSGKLERRGV